MKVEAWYDQDAEEATVVATPEELDALLDAVAALDGPTMVLLYPAEDDQGPELAAGLHGDRGVLRHSGGAFPKGTHSRTAGDPFPLPQWGAVRYYYMSNDTDFPADAEIPAADVRQAAHEYMQTGGERPTCVPWQP